MDIFLHSAFPYLLEKALGPTSAGEPMLVNQSEAKVTFDSPRLANPCGFPRCPRELLTFVNYCLDLARPWSSELASRIRHWTWCPSSFREVVQGLAVNLERGELGVTSRRY